MCPRFRKWSSHHRFPLEVAGGTEGHRKLTPGFVHELECSSLQFTICTAKNVEPADVPSHTGDKQPKENSDRHKTHAPITGVCRQSKMANDFALVGGSA